MNFCGIVGRLVYEPEIKLTTNQTAIISTRIAVSRNDQKRTTDFFSIRIWGKSAEFVSKYFHKGDPIAVTGKLQTDSYERQNGTKVNETYIFVTEVNFVEQKKTDAAPRTEPEPSAAPSVDLPFEI